MDIKEDVLSHGWWINGIRVSHVTYEKDNPKHFMCEDFNLMFSKIKKKKFCWLLPLENQIIVITIYLVKC